MESASNGSPEVYAWNDVIRYKWLWWAVDAEGVRLREEGRPLSFTIRGTRAALIARNAYTRWVRNAVKTNSFDFCETVKGDVPPILQYLGGICLIVGPIAYCGTGLVRVSQTESWKLLEPKFQIAIFLVAVALCCVFSLAGIALLWIARQAQETALFKKFRFAHDGISLHLRDDRMYTYGWDDLTAISSMGLLRFRDGRTLWPATCSPRLAILVRELRKKLFPEACTRNEGLPRRLVIWSALGAIAPPLMGSYFPVEDRGIVIWVLMPLMILGLGFVPAIVVSRAGARLHRAGRRFLRRRFDFRPGTRRAAKTSALN